MASVGSTAELCWCHRRPPESRPPPPRGLPQRAGYAVRTPVAALQPLVLRRASANSDSKRRGVFFFRGISPRAPFGDGAVGAMPPVKSARGWRRTSTAVRAYEELHQQQQQQGDGGQIPRPPVIQWELDLANAVQLIGNVGRDVDLRYLDSGSIVARTSLAVKKKKKKSLQKFEEPSWFELELWDSLAEIAANHLKKGEQVFVTGRITVDKWVKDDIRYHAVKVLVRDLCYVESYDGRRQPDGLSSGVQQSDYMEVGSSNGAVEASSPASSQQSWNEYTSADSSSQGSTGQRESVKTQEDIGTEKRWQEYFADPTQWWDNRHSKKNPKAPDFRHKSTQEVLWLNSWNNPPWVVEQMAYLGEKQAQHAGDFGNSGLRFQEQQAAIGLPTTRMTAASLAPFPGGQASPAELKTPRGSNLVTRATRKAGATVAMAPDDEKMTRRSPLDFPLEWERPGPGRRPDIFPQFSPMKTPLPPPLPADPPEEDEDDEEKKEEDPDKEDKPEERL